MKDFILKFGSSLDNYEESIKKRLKKVPEIQIYELEALIREFFASDEVQIDSLTNYFHLTIQHKGYRIRPFFRSSGCRRKCGSPTGQWIPVFTCGDVLFDVPV